MRRMFRFEKYMDRFKSDFSDDSNENLLIVGSDIPFYNISQMELIDIRDALTFILNDINKRIEKGSE